MEYKYTLSDKVIAYLTLISGLTISAVAVWYSVAGLVSIFAASAVSIIIMGAALEVSKLIATVWLKWNWRRAPKMIKIYLISAIAILMLITSMGIFGYLSKAHLDQNLVSGDVIDKISLIDEKIKTQKDNIEAARKALRQMDEAVDQTMSRSNDEKGADKAAALRRSQQRERSNLQNDIAKSQAEIAKLNEERAPIAKEVRKVEAEVGPIKYIAKLIYGDNPDANILEKAVTWVIIIIVLVFDPLAVVLLLASQYSFQWFRDQKIEEQAPKEESKEEPKEEPQDETQDKSFYPTPSALWPFPVASNEKVEDDFKFLADDKDLYPEGKTWEEKEESKFDEKKPLDEWNEMIAEAEKAVNDEHAAEEESIIEEAAENEKSAMRLWKAEDPNNSVKHQRNLFEKGIIDKLPWENYLRPQADFSDDEAAEEAAKWAQEQLEKKNEERGHYIGLDERPGDYIAESESKKKDNEMDGERGQTTSNQDQGRIEGYVQNAEQGADTIWNRIKKG